MSNSVEEIISKLDSKFCEQPSIRNSVMSSDGEIVRIGRELWQQSPVLREHSVNGIAHKVLSAPKSVLKALNKAYEDGVFPADIRESYDLLATASELELDELTSRCFEHLHSINAIEEPEDLPAELSVGTVVRLFKVLLDSPLRTFDVYDHQLSRIARYCANSQDVMTNAMNLLKQSLGRFKSINVEGIPIGFKARSVPVVIYKRMGKLQTAVIIGGEVKPVNLFGDRINLENVSVADGFYLKYGEYLLYCCGRKVYLKNLRDDSEPIEQLRDCRILMTRGRFVFAAHDEHGCHSISLWTDDGKFEKIYQSVEKITMIAFDYRTRLLAVNLSSPKLLLFRLENKSLYLLEETCEGYPDIFDVYPTGGGMFLLRSNNEGSRIEKHRVATAGRSIDEKPDDKELTTTPDCPKAWRRLVYQGGSYFLNDSKRLELVVNFPSLDEIKTLMTDGECHATSELWMFP